MTDTCNVADIKWDPDIDPDMDHDVRASFAVQYGRLWLADGWTACSSIIEGGVSSAESTILLESFVLTQNVKTVNCMLKYLMFQGLPNNNIVTSLAEAKVPLVQLTIAPTCRDIPPSCEGGSTAGSDNIMCTTTYWTQQCADAGGVCVSCTCNPDPKDVTGPFCGAPFSKLQVCSSCAHASTPSPPQLF
jgi:hypothetical protein